MIEIDPLKQSQLIESEVNVSSKDSQLKSFFQLFTGLLVALLILTSALFLMADVMVMFIPDSWEDRIHLAYAKKSSLGGQTAVERRNQTDLEIEHYLQEIINKIKKKTRLAEAPVTIDLLKSDQINAFAAIGYRLYLTSATYNSANSENELAMILCHELAHLDLRHNFKQSARNLIIFLSGFILGQEQALSFAESVTQSINLGYSRSQEDLADLYAIDLYSKVYDGNSSDVLRFYQRLSSQENMASKATAYFSTHPASTTRLERLEKQVMLLGMEEKGLIKKKITEDASMPATD